MPPHLGHVYLCEFAQHWTDELAIVVGTLENEPIPGHLRHQWMRELFPKSQVLHLTDENPQYPHEHPDFWAIWKASLERILPWPVDYVFASEDYGYRLAQELGAEYVPVDHVRTAVPMSGTQMRQAPMTHWDYLPPCVRPYFLKRVCIFGPESTGKSTLSQRLAAHYHTLWVPEYARLVIEQQAGEIHFEDLPRVVKGQLASEAALARQAHKLLFCDTDPLSTTLWSEVLFGKVAPEVAQAAQEHSYDLYLLCDVDVPWVADVVRYLPDERVSFFESCKALLEKQQRPYVVIRGSWEERFARAVRAVDGVLKL